MRMPTFTKPAAWALADQILSSGTNFGAGVVVARTVGPAGYGSFTLAFGTWVVLLGATRAMLVQPYTVVVSGVSAHDWRSATKGTVAAVLVFGVIFGLAAIGVGAMLGARTPTGSTFLALGIFAAPLALQDFWRFAAFSQNSPRAATHNDGIWAIVQAISLAALAATNSLTSATAVGAWGLGAFAGALFGLRQFQLWPSLGPNERRFIRQNARLAGWYGAANASFHAGSYGTLLLIGAGAGPTALGGLGSAGTLLAPARLVAASGEALMLPIVARVAREENRQELRKLCRSYSLGFAGFFALVGGVLILAGPWFLRFLFGPLYVPFSTLLLPVVAASVIAGLASGLSLGFRALGEGRDFATIHIVSSAGKVAIVAASLPFGITAAAWGLAAAELLRTALTWVLFENAAARLGADDRRSAEHDKAPLLHGGAVLRSTTR